MEHDKVKLKHMLIAEVDIGQRALCVTSPQANLDESL
jgi:hypothetical protein